jgi:hypothetical protein
LPAAPRRTSPLSRMVLPGGEVGVVTVEIMALRWCFSYTAERE